MQEITHWEFDENGDNVAVSNLDRYCPACESPNIDIINIVDKIPKDLQCGDCKKIFNY